MGCGRAPRPKESASIATSSITQRLIARRTTKAQIKISRKKLLLPPSAVPTFLRFSCGPASSLSPSSPLSFFPLRFSSFSTGFWFAFGNEHHSCQTYRRTLLEPQLSPNPFFRHPPSSSSTFPPSFFPSHRLLYGFPPRDTTDAEVSK